MNAMRKKNKLRFRVNKCPILDDVDLSKRMTFKLRPQRIKKGVTEAVRAFQTERTTRTKALMIKWNSVVQEPKTKNALNSPCCTHFPWPCWENIIFFLSGNS